MKPLRIIIAEPLLAAISTHLVPPHSETEEAAFMFAAYRQGDVEDEFEVAEWQPVGPEGFVTRSAYFLELEHDQMASAIKRAHDLGACLLEAHSHPTQREPHFSWSDLVGFDECVPHALWRLKGRPYGAIVMSQHGFDGVAWTEGTVNNRRSITHIVSAGHRLPATGHSHVHWDRIHADRPL